MRTLFIALTRNALSLIGAAITTASAVVIISLFAVEYVGTRGSPYIGILAYLVLPAIFVVGLLLIPLGVLRERRRERRAAESGQAPPAFPVIDLNRDRTRRIVLATLALTAINVVILATATYKGVEVMDSTEFCATTCHVMRPERTAYARSPHARVGCVECHIGPGADWFVKSKLSGAWQVVATAFDLYPRPIPTPIENLRPARETCEHCHWPTQFVGDRLKVVTRYAEDEANTETKTVLLLRVGGVEGRRSHGIHWHVDPGIEIRYRSDATRQTIGVVELRGEDGAVTRFAPKDSGGETGDGAEGEADSSLWRVMDCVDCHNRPTHIYRMPEAEVDRAIQQERIDRTLPWIRREAVHALREPYPSEQAAREGIAGAVAAFYQESYPEVARYNALAVAAAGRVLGELWGQNVFPEMNVGWGTYPNHLGHMDFPGCFRCHDGEHETADGRAISQDCDTCHTLLAMEEESPEILEHLRP